MDGFWEIVTAPFYFCVGIIALLLLNVIINFICWLLSVLIAVPLTVLNYAWDFAFNFAKFMLLGVWGAFGDKDLKILHAATMLITGFGIGHLSVLLHKAHVVRPFYGISLVLVPVIMGLGSYWLGIRYGEKVSRKEKALCALPGVCFGMAYAIMRFIA